MKLLYLIPIALMLLPGCGKKGCLESAGAPVQVKRVAGPIREILLQDHIDLVLQQDSVESISVAAGAHLEPFVETSLESGKLTIKNNLKCQWLRDPSEKITVTVSVKALEKLDYEGSGNVVSSNTLKSDRITFYSELGAGNMEVSLQARQTFSYIMDENADFILHGKTEAMWSYTNSRGTIDFSDFEVQHMVIEYGGVRNATINVIGTLDAIIYYQGNLYYKGNPVVTRNTRHSTGSLIKLP